MKIKGVRRFVTGIALLLLLFGIAISLHATPHLAITGVYNWEDIGQICMALTVIWLMGFLSGTGFNSED